MSLIPPDLVKTDGNMIGPGMSSVLGIKGAKSQPQAIDMAAIQPTYDVQQGGFTFDQTSCKSGVWASTSIAGVASSAFPMLGPLGWQLTARDPVIQTVNGQNGRVLTFDGEITFDAAGIAAFAGKTLWLEAVIGDTLISPTRSIWMHVFEILCVAGKTRYPIYMGATNWLGFIPWPYSLFLRPRSVDGTVFPANTTFGAGLQCLVKERGAWLPM